MEIILPCYVATLCCLTGLANTIQVNYETTKNKIYSSLLRHLTFLSQPLLSEKVGGFCVLTYCYFLQQLSKAKRPRLTRNKGSSRRGGLLSQMGSNSSIGSFKGKTSRKALLEHNDSRSQQDDISERSTFSRGDRSSKLPRLCFHDNKKKMGNLLNP